MKKCTPKPGQNYPRVLTFTTNTPERGLHLLENKSSGHLPKTFQSRALKNPFMVLICCWLCSFAYRLGRILSSQGRHYQHRELSSNSEWSCVAMAVPDSQWVSCQPWFLRRKKYKGLTYLIRVESIHWLPQRKCEISPDIWGQWCVCVCVWVCVLSQQVVWRRTESMDTVEWPVTSIYKLCVSG